MKKIILASSLAIILSVPVKAQLGTPFVTGDLSLISCVIGNLGFQTAGSVGLYVCNPVNTWTLVVAVNSAVPTGAIIFIDTGTCPTGYAEESSLNGRMWRGTIAANANVGTTAGSDSITPTVASLLAAAQTFTGSSANTSLVSAGTPAGTNGTGTVTATGTINTPTISWPAGVPTYTGTVNTLAVTAHTVVATKQGAAAGNVVTTATHAITGIPGGTVAWPAGVPTNSSLTFTGSSATTSAQVFTGSALGTHQHTLTAIGTNGTSAVTGTLNQFDNRPAYINLIGCKKN